ncbi:MAG: fluoride efflux transporter CrcB [Steroidobacteraceae bacterium]
MRRILAARSRRSAVGLRLLRKSRTRRPRGCAAARSAREIRLTEPAWHWYLLVALGSGLGGASRLFVSTLVGRMAGYTFPWGTLVVNVLGCLAVGALGALFAPSNPLHDRQELRVLLIIGMLGGFTTFSAFSLETLQLVERGSVGAAAAYAVASLVLCLLAAALSYALVTSLLR